MKDVIVVGAGKASLLHYRSYKKIKNKGNIYFVDIKGASKYIRNKQIYLSIKDCIIDNNLNSENLIADICTPKSEFLNIIEECKKLKIKNILVEKPFVFNVNNTKMKEKLNIVMVENYLYSKLTNMIKKYIDDNKKEISLIYTNFSKNRVSESLNRRGYTDKVTLNYEIEIPHQIYLTQYFLNNFNDIQNLIACSIDLKIENTSLENHGYGLIISKINDVDLIYESNLASLVTQKRIIICTKDNYTIEGNYAIYSNDLKLIKPASLNIYFDGKLIISKKLKEDDNFTYFMKNAYLYFNNKNSNPNYVDIALFSKIMNLYCNNLLNRKKR